MMAWTTKLLAVSLSEALWYVLGPQAEPDVGVFWLSQPL